MQKSNTYRGITWDSMSGLSKKLGKSTSYVCNYKRRHPNATDTDIIDMVLDKKLINTKEYRGITWSTLRELSNKLGKYDGFMSYYIRYHKPITVEEAIDNILSPKNKSVYKKVNTYRGITWSTDRELSSKLNVCKNYVANTKQRHPDMSNEDIIDYVLGKEYRGIKWSNKSELSIALNKSYTYITVLQRRHPNITDEEIIDMVLDKPREYRGIKWCNDNQLCRALGRGWSYAYQLRRKYPNITDEEIIDYSINSRNNNTHSYRGIVWKNKRDLAHKLGKDSQFIYQTLRRYPYITCNTIIDCVLDGIKIYNHKDVTGRECSEYRGIIWRNNKDLSVKLGKSIDYVAHELSINPKLSIFDIIDNVLDKRRK